MVIKIGNIVSHTGALEWGAGKVMEITASSAMIQFSDGKNRKIAVSHFTTLQPAAPNSFLPPPEVLVETKGARAAKSPRASKKKL
ncbi:MAG: DUF3553 domain-containing protein [Oryzomonas sp.]|uniref:DUF3553 domain-containing protein n=1 Tax=Oryzomonas sp. TaxID=2855186 RepID=UPI00284B1997|nr:DUF3553 domain-containing protein [Oryzomonas sp.]MDR3580786.1 DUF3553 domain-containing protein [Oryzomonas sp.]